MTYDNVAISHITLIQGVITRLETNSFTLKALAMAFAAATLGFSGSVALPNWVYPLAGFFPVLVFWIMDAHYLRLGRLFRRLYDAVRNEQVEEPFSMNFTVYEREEKSTLAIALSWSILWFYLSIVLVLAIVSVNFFWRNAVTEIAS